MTKRINHSPGKAGLARGELKTRIIEMLTRPHTNFTIPEICEALGANPNTVKSTKWMLEHPVRAREIIEKSNRKAAMRRARRNTFELKRLQKQLQKPAGEQLDMFKTEPTPAVTIEPTPEPTPVVTIEPTPVVEQLPPPPSVIHVDMVNSPSHYTDGGIETIDYIRAKLSRAEYIGYLRGNIFKYSSRLGKKDDIAQDAAKLAWYTNELASFLKGDK